MSKNEIEVDESNELNDTIQAETFVKHLGEYHLNYKNELYYYNGFVWIKANGLDNIKIDIKRENGQEFFNGDKVFVPELNRHYTVKVDKRDMIYYNPYFPNPI